MKVTISRGRQGSIYDYPISDCYTLAYLDEVCRWFDCILYNNLLNRNEGILDIFDKGEYREVVGTISYSPMDDLLHVVYTYGGKHSVLPYRVMAYNDVVGYEIWFKFHTHPTVDKPDCLVRFSYKDFRSMYFYHIIYGTRHFGLLGICNGYGHSIGGVYFRDTSLIEKFIKKYNLTDDDILVIREYMIHRMFGEHRKLDLDFQTRFNIAYDKLSKVISGIELVNYFYNPYLATVDRMYSDGALFRSNIFDICHLVEYYFL